MPDPNPFDQFDAPQSDSAALGGRLVIRKGATPPSPPSAPSGYRFSHDGSALEAIPGGPADPSKDAPKIGTSPLSGEAYLKTLDSGTQGLVKALSDGRKSFPSGAALKSPYWQEMLTHVSNYDPGFDEVNYTGRSATRRDFTSGKASNNIRALNTAIGHLGHLEEQIPGTASHSFTPINAIENAGKRLLGDAGPTNFDTTVSALAGELTAVYRGSGGAEADINRYIQQLNPNASKEQKTGAIRNIVGLLKSRLDALNDQYKQGMGTTAQQLQLLDPQAQLIVQHLGGFDDAGAPQDKPDPQAPVLGPNGGGTPPENPIANGGPGDMGPTLTPSDGSLSSLVNGSTRSVIDPKKQALGQQIVSLVSKGAPPNVIMGFAVGADPSLRTDPKFHAWVSQAIQYRQQHPHAQFSIDPGFYTTEVPLSTSEKVGNAIGNSAPGAVGLNAANAVTAGNFGHIVGDEEGVNRALAVANAQHPTASVLGSAGGGATAALGLEAALAKAGVAGLPASIGADMGYGAATGATNSDNPLTGGAKGALVGLLGSAAGRGIAKGAGAAASGVTNPTVSYVAREAPGALTVGQAVGQSGVVGKAIKGVEDRLSGIPVVGDAINARRLEGLQKMNSKAFDKALEPIKETAAGQFGEQAVQDAQDKVSQAFSKALGGKVASVDHGFIADAAAAKNAIKALPASVSKDVENHVDTAIQDYVDPSSLSISGENMQALLRDLQQVKKGYRSDPAGHRVGKAIDQMTASIENLFRRQAPDVMPQYDAAKQAFKRVSTLEDAVLKAKNTNGVFTPGQLGLSDRANTVAFGGKHAAAAGKGEFHDFQRNMQEVLPNKVPDSGTAGRLVLPALAIGAGAGGGELSGNETTGLTLGGLIAAAYTRTGQRALTSAVLKRGASAKAVGEGIKKTAPALGHAAGSVAALGTTRD